MAESPLSRYPIERKRERIEPVFEAGTVSILAIGDLQFETKANLHRRDGVENFPAAEMRQANLGEIQYWKKLMEQRASQFGETDPKVQSYRAWQTKGSIPGERSPIPTDVDFPLAGEAFQPYVGIRDYEIQGSKIELDIFPVTYPTYLKLSTDKNSERSLEVAGLLGNSVILFTADEKIIVQHRSKRNQNYGDIIGASASGNMEGAFMNAALPASERNRENRGKIEPLTQSGLAKHMQEELFQEDKVAPTELTELKLVGFGRDNRKPHYEAIWLGRTALTSEQITTNAGIVQTGLEQSNRHFDEAFFAVDGTQASMERLLLEFNSPIAPTHLAAFITVLHRRIEYSAGKIAADQYLRELQPKLQAHLAEIDAKVQHFYQEHPEKLPTKYQGQVPSGYDPSILPQNQGLPTVEEELHRLGLLN